jgi:hypothetical protein
LTVLMFTRSFWYMDCRWGMRVRLPIYQ